MTRRTGILFCGALLAVGVALWPRDPEPRAVSEVEAPKSRPPTAHEFPAPDAPEPPSSDPAAPERNAFTDGSPEVFEQFDLANEDLAWERRLSAILGAAGVSDSMKARVLLEMLASLPEEALATAAEEAANRLPDKDYAAAQARLTNPQTHGMVLSALFADLLERPDAITLPVLLALARMPAHPLAAEAAENLELLTGGNFGKDWSRWDAEVRRQIGQPPPAGAAAEP